MSLYMNLTHSPPPPPLAILLKMNFETTAVIERFSGHCRAIELNKRITKPFKGRTLCGLLIQMKNITLQSLGMCRKQNFEIRV